MCWNEFTSTDTNTLKAGQSPTGVIDPSVYTRLLPVTGTYQRGTAPVVGVGTNKLGVVSIDSDGIFRGQRVPAGILVLQVVRLTSLLVH